MPSEKPVIHIVGDNNHIEIHQTSERKIGFENLLSPIRLLISFFWKRNTIEKEEN